MLITVLVDFFFISRFYLKLCWDMPDILRFPTPPPFCSLMEEIFKIAETHYYFFVDLFICRFIFRNFTLLTKMSVEIQLLTQNFRPPLIPREGRNFQHYFFSTHLCHKKYVYSNFHTSRLSSLEWEIMCQWAGRCLWYIEIYWIYFAIFYTHNFK